MNDLLMLNIYGVRTSQSLQGLSKARPPLVFAVSYHVTHEDPLGPSSRLDQLGVDRNCGLYKLKAQTFNQPTPGLGFLEAGKLVRL